MTLKERLINFKKCLELEIGEPIIEEFQVERNRILVENVIIEAGWLNYFIVRENKMVEDRIYGMTMFRDEVLYAEAIENFDQYYASKQGIKKFNL